MEQKTKDFIAIYLLALLSTLAIAANVYNLGLMITDCNYHLNGYCYAPSVILASNSYSTVSSSTTKTWNISSSPTNSLVLPFTDTVQASGTWLYPYGILPQGYYPCGLNYPQDFRHYDPRFC